MMLNKARAVPPRASCRTRRLLRTRSYCCGRLEDQVSPTPESMRSLSLLALSLLGACATTHRAPEFINATGGPVRPFSPAVRVNGMLYLAGQLGVDSTGTLARGGIQPETRQALENIRAVLQSAGSSMDKVVKCTVFLADMKEWAAMNEVYVTFFDPARRPARSAFGTTGLALNGRLE